MANKPYFTLKKANEVLSLYGIQLKKVYEFWGGEFKNTHVAYTYVAIKVNEPIPKWSWEATKIYIPYDRKTNIQRVEYVLENLERLK